MHTYRGTPQAQPKHEHRATIDDALGQEVLHPRPAPVVRQDLDTVHVGHEEVVNKGGLALARLARHLCLERHERRCEPRTIADESVETRSTSHQPTRIDGP